MAGHCRRCRGVRRRDDGPECAKMEFAEARQDRPNCAETRQAVDAPRRVFDLYLTQPAADSHIPVMPSSRRRRTTQADDIEDPTQAPRPEPDDVDMDDEEDEPRPRRTKGKGKAPTNDHRSRSAARRHANGDGADAMVDEEPFDADGFGNRPITAIEGQKLQGIALDWDQTALILKNSAFTLLNEVASAVAEINDGKDSEVRFTLLFSIYML